MALPALNNKTAMGNLSLDDKSQILTSLVQSGKLQLANYGAINFNQNITQTGATAVKESSSNVFGEGVVRALNEIKGILYDLNNTMLRYVESTTTSQQVTQNLLEAKAKDIEVKQDGGAGFVGKDNVEKFYNVFESMNAGITSLVGDVSKMGTGGMFGTGKGFLGGLLSSLIPKLLKGFLFGAAGVGIYKIIDKIDDGEINGSPMKKLNKFVKDSLGIDFSEEGENQDQGGSATPTGPTGTASTSVGTSTGTQVPSSPTGITPQSPATSTPSSPTSTGITRTSTPASKIITNSGDIASDADLTGLNFANHTSKGLPLKIEKQIKKSLAQRLQYIRKKLGKTLNITSGYRPEWYNRKLKGSAKDSNHIKGIAADIVTSGMSLEQKKTFVRAAVECGIGGMGFYNTFIHVDLVYRKNGQMRRWGAVPNWAVDMLNNPQKYKMGSENFDQGSTSTVSESEENENKDTNTTSQPTTSLDTKTQTSGDISSPKTSAKGKETAIPEQGTTATPEEEEESEEVGDKVLTESTKKIGKTEELSSATKTSSKSSLSGPEKVILDFVSASEGTTKYGYNTAFGGSYKPLTTMTVKQVRNLQRESAKRKGSSAMGRYQIMGFNVDRFLKSGAIKETDLFDENTQDKLGKLFLKEDANLDGWKSGKIDNTKFGHNLSKIWAGISDPFLGEKVSHHMFKGKRQNAKYDKNTLLATLANAKGGKQETAIAAAPATSIPTETEQPQTTKDATQPEVTEEPKTTADTITEDITANLKEFEEKIKNLKPGELKSKIDEGLFSSMKTVGEAIGLDTSRLKKLPEYKSEETIATAKLTPEVSESAGKRVEESVKSLEAKKEEKAEKVQIAAQQNQQQQQPIVNVNASGKGGSEGSPAVGGITQMDVRDSILHQTQYRKGTSAITV